MLLGYIDESGINYQLDKNGYFCDGPYSIWTCVLVNEKKYFDIERGLQDIAKNYLPDKLKNKELHGSEIWEFRKNSKEDEKRIKTYFEELLQFTGKIRLPVVISVQQKKYRNVNKAKDQKIESSKGKFSLLSGIEYRLSELNETAVLISDLETSQIPTPTYSLQRMLNERTKWRYSNGKKNLSGIKPKYLYEFKSTNIVDQLHYVDSKSSILIQYCDQLCFVVRKCLEHLYLINYPKEGRPLPDVYHLPITDTTFNSFLNFCKATITLYDEKSKDVQFIEDYPIELMSFSKTSLTISNQNGSTKYFFQNISPYR